MEQAKQEFYSGSYQTVITELSKPDFISKLNLGPADAAKVKILLYRSYLANKRYNLVLNELKLKSSPNTNDSLQALQLLASFLSSPTSNPGNVALAKSFLDSKMAIVQQNPDISILLASFFANQELYDDAFSVLSACPKDLECIGLMVQLYCVINRMDLAIDLIQHTKHWAGDAPLTQMIDGWIALCRGNAPKFDEAYYLFEEMAATHPFSSKILCLKAVCLIQGRKYQEAEYILLEALNINPNDADTVANLIVVGLALQKPDQVINQYFAQLQDIDPNHHLMIGKQEKSDLFDQCASKFEF